MQFSYGGNCSVSCALITMCVMLLAITFMHDMLLAAIVALQQPSLPSFQPLLLCLPRVARVRELHSAIAVEASSVNMRVALDGARACKNVLVKLLGDPWAREGLSGREARLTQLDAIAADMQSTWTSSLSRCTRPWHHSRQRWHLQRRSPQLLTTVARVPL